MSEPSQLPNQTFCTWCNEWKWNRGFHMHEPACKERYLERSGARSEQITSTAARTLQAHGQQSSSDISTGAVAAASSQALSPSAMDMRSSSPLSSSPYFRIIYHPNSRRPEDIVLLESDSGSLVRDAPAVPGSGPRSLLSISEPWAPFRSYADFTFAETMVSQRRSNGDIDTFLRLIDSEWSVGGSSLSFRSHRDLQLTLDAAKKLVVPFQQGSVTESWNGQPITFTFEYRDPWQWILSLVKDPAFAAMSNWHAFRKFLCSDGKEERWFDHPKSATRCWDIEDNLPPPNPHPHFFACIHIWSDKALMTKTTKKHPVLARASWLPVEVFSASGNGGGMLLILMPIILHPDGPDADAAPDSAFGLFKMRVYQKIYGVVFASLHIHSLVGCATACGDLLVRIIWPGLLIASLDGEESFYFCACKAAGAKVPCNCCLVHKENLSNLGLRSERRTTATMKKVYEDAQALPSKTAREAHLTAFGLRDVPHFLWEFGNSDPYQARSYDELHFDDEGKWGKHLWPLILERLDQLNVSKTFDHYLTLIPRWRTLRHITNVTTMEYADGNVYRDLLRVILPCLVAVLPKNDPLIHCTRAFQKYRAMNGLHCISDGRLAKLKDFIQKYEVRCKSVTAAYHKDFNFYKQHMCTHVIDDIRATGTLNNKTTKVGEAFQQEIKEAYLTTNFKSTVDHQIGNKDADMEVIAQLRTAINDFNRISLSDNESLDVGEDSFEDSNSPDDGWKLSAPKGGWVNPFDFQETQAALDADYADFYLHLRDTVSHALQAPIGPFTTMKIRFFKCLHVYFQSQEDFKQGHDILRCNERFHGRPRYDCIIYRTSDGYLGFGRLRHIVRCDLSTQQKVDVAVVTRLVESKWRPTTLWEDYSVYDEETSLSFVAMDDVFRGALMCPAFGSDRERTYYSMDDVDGDMFLRLNQL